MRNILEWEVNRMNDSKISKKYVIFIIFSIIFLVTPYPLLSIAILLSGILYYLDKICDYLKKDGKNKWEKE
ncbi:hypothetical protein BLAHAN_06821 [Blautia hansenii DSM 20583]|jgi:hypothetical protein|uniref:Uncharacterized protein n=2 Tax=Blautia hansenii TaxID=1322 RepID=C9LBL3_BLAHA|nr:hypothetical protein CGC63_04820 [Blautia hansenii DSM 20583]EEX20520.1 hypothetical protein BLAHAN_06821 [Blautia hansenii DSM 20583]